jgi:phospholipid/cholesterol/gamma-HCH transport system substrate-binding protein
MRDDRTNYLIVGTLVIAMVVTLVVWLALLSGRTGATDPYHIIYANVSGLNAGSQVYYEGFPVGRIESVSPVREAGHQRFRVDVSIKRGWQIPRDSLAEVSASGILSAIFIDIRAGTASSFLEPGDRIRSGDPAHPLAVLSTVSSQVRDLMEEELRPLLASLRVGAPQTLAKLDRTLDELVARLNRFMESNEGDLGAIVGDLQHVLESLYMHIDEINGNIESAARNMNELSIDLRENPSLLIRGRKSEAEGERRRE